MRIKVFPISEIYVTDHKADGGKDVSTIQRNVDMNGGHVHFPPSTMLRDEPVAIVGYGPSLARTWGQLREFKNIWTVSGAHDFLLARGIRPTHHTDMDWRPHKHTMLVQPQADVRYIMANTIDPNYTKKIEGYKPEFFQPRGDKVAHFFRMGEYPALKVPGDVATAAVRLAYEAGFREMTTFGIDGSYDFDGTIKLQKMRGGTHAGEHPGLAPLREYVTDDEHMMYETSMTLLIACHKFYALADSLEDARITVVSDGLLPAWIDMETKRNGSL